jgi:hypothetical protein
MLKLFCRDRFRSRGFLFKTMVIMFLMSCGLLTFCKKNKKYKTNLRTWADLHGGLVWPWSHKKFKQVNSVIILVLLLQHSNFNLKNNTLKIKFKIELVVVVWT